MTMTAEEFIEHYGVQGMKWGLRRKTNKASVEKLQAKGLTPRQAKNTTKVQNRVDAQKMVAMGRQGKVNVGKQLKNRSISNRSLSPSTILAHPLSSKKAATRQLQVNRDTQMKVAAGQKRVTAALAKVRGVSIADLNFDT